MASLVSSAESIFLKVEAVLNSEWIKNSPKGLTQVLAEIEELGVGGISFHRGNHVIIGSLDQLVKIKEHFCDNRTCAETGGSTKNNTVSSDFANNDSNWKQNTLTNSSDYRQMNEKTNRSSNFEEYPEVANSAGAELDWRNHAVRSNHGFSKLHHNEMALEKDVPQHDDIEKMAKDIMVDNDIWEYIEMKKMEELKNLEAMFNMKVNKCEDDSGVLRIGFSPCSEDTALEDLDLIYESLVNLYQETFNQCVIEKHEVYIADKEASLVLDYISSNYPNILAKRCIFNDDFLFIGSPYYAKEARRIFQQLVQRLKRGDLKSALSDKAAFTKRNQDPSPGYGCHYYDKYGYSVKKDADKYERFINDEMSLRDNLSGELELNPLDNSSPEVTNDTSVDFEELKAMEEQVDTENDFQGYVDIPDDVVLDNLNEKITVKPETESKEIPALGYSRDTDEEEIEVIDINKSGGQNSDKMQKVLQNEGRSEAGKTSISTPFMQAECIEKRKNKSEKVVNSQSSKDLEKQFVEVEETDENRVVGKVGRTARINANSITYHSLGMDVGQNRMEKACKSDSIDCINSETVKDRPGKTKKRYDSCPKVTIVKQTVPVFPESSESSSVNTKGAREKVGVSTKKCVDGAKVSSEKIHATSKSFSSEGHLEAAVDLPREVLEPGEEKQLKELFQAQRKMRKRMPYDSPPSSEDEVEHRTQHNTSNVSRLHKTTEAKQVDIEIADSTIEELASCVDDESVKVFEPIFQKSGNKGFSKSTEVLPENKTEVENEVPEHTDHNMEDGAQAQIQLIAADAVQPPDGTIGCIIDKAYHLKGHEKSGTVEISISFEAGVQKDDQPEPGRPYKGLKMKAFLPASGDGRETLRLMKSAFTAQKLFIIKRNPVLHDGDTIVPNGVDFKENIDSFPDPGYLPKAMEQLRLLIDNQ